MIISIFGPSSKAIKTKDPQLLEALCRNHLNYAQLAYPICRSITMILEFLFYLSAELHPDDIVYLINYALEEVMREGKEGKYQQNGPSCHEIF